MSFEDKILYLQRRVEEYKTNPPFPSQVFQRKVSYVLFQKAFPDVYSLPNQYLYRFPEVGFLPEHEEAEVGEIKRLLKKFSEDPNQTKVHSEKELRLLASDILERIQDMHRFQDMRPDLAAFVQLAGDIAKEVYLSIGSDLIKKDLERNDGPMDFSNQESQLSSILDSLAIYVFPLYDELYRRLLNPDSWVHRKCQDVIAIMGKAQEHEDVLFLDMIDKHLCTTVAYKKYLEFQEAGETWDEIDNVLSPQDLNAFENSYLEFRKELRRKAQYWLEELEKVAG